jgi:hypothetical protein
LKKKILVLVSLAVALAMILLVVVSCQNATTAETSAAATVAETSAAGTTVAEASDSSVVAGEEGACADCHNSSTQIVSKDVQYSGSVHATGEAFSRNTAACAVCHTSEGFTARIDAKATLEVAADAPAIQNASPVNCRTCHNIHETYTKADWSLAKTDAVTLELTGDVYDKGSSNLCASCHQPRTSTKIPVAGGADIEITSARFGPHHGPQSSMLLGVGGYGEYKGSSVHYDSVDEGCITCHMTDTAFGNLAGGHTMNVTYDAEGESAEYLTGCLTCHEDIESFDRNGVQTEITALAEEVRLALVKKGLIVAEVVEGEIPAAVPGTYTADQAGALWNYKTVMEDRSMGIHNPGYTKFLLETALEALKK